MTKVIGDLTMASPKQKVFLRSQDVQTIRELRQMLSAWCDLHQVADMKSVEALSSTASFPLALIVEPAAPQPAIAAESSGPNNEVIRFLSASRDRFPAMRRIVISDNQDLSATIHGLHSGIIDTLLHRPFDAASVFTAIRIQKLSAGTTASTQPATR